MKAARWMTTLGAATAAFAMVAAPTAAQIAGGGARTVVVKMENFGFSPSSITVMPGDTIVFEQTTKTPHNVQFVKTPNGALLGDHYVPPTQLASEHRPAGIASFAASQKAGDPPAAPKMGPFLMAKGQEEVIVVGRDLPPGEYDFVCTPHASLGMKGKLVVVGTEAGG